MQTKSNLKFKPFPAKLVRSTWPPAPVSANPGAAIESRKATKIRTHFDNCRAEGIFFQPLVVETFGGWDKDAINFLKKIATKGSRRWGLTNAIAIKQFFQRLSIELQRDNAALLFERDSDTSNAVT